MQCDFCNALKKKKAPYLRLEHPVRPSERPRRSEKPRTHAAQADGRAKVDEVHHGQLAAHAPEAPEAEGAAEIL